MDYDAEGRDWRDTFVLLTNWPETVSFLKVRMGYLMQICIRKSD